MLYTVTVKQQALDEALEAYLYYEEKQEGLGDRFLNSLRKRYGDLSRNPQYFSFIYADREKTLRDVIVEDFPFVIMYDIVGTEVIVYSVHNTYKKME